MGEGGTKGELEEDVEAYDDSDFYQVIRTPYREGYLAHKKLPTPVGL